MKELYKKHRPKTLKGVIGNKSTVATLKNMIERKTVPHTILFHGESGCGKTTLARILKEELECADIDFQELNCSDFRGIDTTREIRQTMHLAPVGGTCRIWLLDEVHQMTTAGQEAALKIFEDTPDHIYFFLCTTNPQKLISTIRNRCTEMPVEPLDRQNMLKLIQRISKREKIKFTADIIEDVIDASEGSARKCLVLLDKLKNLPENQRSEAIGAQEDEKEGIDLCRALIQNKEWSFVSKILRDIKGEPESIRWAVMGYCSGCLLGNAKNKDYIFHILTCFENHFYDSKKFGLVRACYQAVNGDF
ncbi:MAG: DNA polymerase III subunit [Candidatus Heimdallarchaeaceae archaeon]